jgi:hypothetical protein
MATILNRQVTFATNGTVTAAGLHNLIDETEIYAGIITTQPVITSVGSSDQLLIADADLTPTSAPRRVTVGSMFNDALNNGIYTNSSFTGTLTAGSFVGQLNGNVTGTIIGTGGTISSLTTGTTTSTAANITNGTVQTLTASTANITTGTVATLNSTTGTITNLSATTSTFLGTITGSTNVVNIGSGQIYKDATGNVGIGTTSPNSKLSVYGANTSDSGAIYTANILNTATAASGVGSGLVFGTNVSTTATNNVVAMSGIEGIKENGTSNDVSSALKFTTRAAAGNLVERLRIDSSGNVGINNTTPSSRLEVIHTGGQGINCVNNGGAGTVNYSIMGQSSGSASANTGIYANVYNASSNYGVRIVNPPAGASNWAIYSDAAAQSYFTGNVGIGATTPANKLEIVGSFGRGAPVTKTGDFTLADTENWIIVNKGSAGTATLPAASSWTGREFTIKVITAHTVVSASSNVVPRNSTTAGTAILAAAAGNWATLVSNGTNWVAMCGS